jgi:hypothetical protein
MLVAECSYLEELKATETFEIKYRKELVLEMSGYICKINRQKKKVFDK